MDQGLRSYLAEFIGTFTLVFIGTAVATLQGPGMLDMGPAGWLGICFAFGFTLMVLVLVIGPVSGCHINPAVSVPMALAGRLKWAHLPGYVVAQCAGALVASLVLLALLKGSTSELLTYTLADDGLGANGNPMQMATSSLFGFELVLTALFLFVIFAATRHDVPSGFAGIAIGGFLFLAHLIGAPLGDSSLNPARSLGPALVEQGAALEVLWVFIVAPVIGGVLGLILYRLTYSEG